MRHFLRCLKYLFRIQSAGQWLSVSLLSAVLLFLWSFVGIHDDKSPSLGPLILIVFPILQGLAAHRWLLDLHIRGDMDFLTIYGLNRGSFCVINVLMHVFFISFPMVGVMFFTFSSFNASTGGALFLYFLNCALLISFYQCLMIKYRGNALLSVLILVPLMMPFVLFFMMHLYIKPMSGMIMSFSMLHFSLHFLITPSLLKHQLKP
jgi:hypothetical protein